MKNGSFGYEPNICNSDWYTFVLKFIFILFLFISQTESNQTFNTDTSSYNGTIAFFFFYYNIFIKINRALQEMFV